MEKKFTKNVSSRSLSPQWRSRKSHLLWSLFLSIFLFAFSSSAHAQVTVYQAEDYSAQSGSSVGTNNAGYTGIGFFDFGLNGSYGEWNNINSPTEGVRLFEIIYANGSAANRQAEITVNGVSFGNIPFAPTGGWTEWKKVSLSLPMNVGDNIIKITANTATGGPNVDRFEVETIESFRYLKLTVSDAVSKQNIVVNEINWLVNSDVYPSIRTIETDTNVAAPGTNNGATAWKAYDGDSQSPASVWRPNSPSYPYSIVIDLESEEAITPTGIQISILSNDRAMSSFSCEGSNDSITWTQLYSISGLTKSDWESNTFNTFNFPDTQAPTIPGGLSTSDENQDSFTLSWDASSDNIGVVSYEVFAGAESKGKTTSTSMEITSLECNTLYAMTVKAEDAAGNVSAASFPLSVSTSVCEGTSENLISNGEFDSGTEGWRAIFHSPASGSFGVDTDANISGPNAGKLSINTGGVNWQIELFTVFNLVEGKTYDISFKAKAAENRTAMATFQRGSDPYTTYWQQNISLTTTSQEFSFRWTSNISDPVTRLNFRAGGSDADVWLDEIVVKEVILTGDNEAPTAPSNLAITNIAENSLMLSWDASTDNVGVASYEVFAGITSMGTTAATSLDIAGLNCSSNYSFRVVAKDEEGNVSVPSAAKGAVTGTCSGPVKPKTAQLGMNLSSPRSWNAEFFFTNLAHHSLAWMPLSDAFPSFSGRIPVSELTADRYLQPGATGMLTILWDLNSELLSTGEYVFTYEGTAEVALTSYSGPNINEVSNTPGRIVVNIGEAGSSRFLFFEVTSNSETDPIKNISFRELDREHSTDIFRPEFVNDYKSLKAFRFMDWAQVNNSNVSRWEDYPAENALLQTGGVSYDYMIALANEANMDAWFCAPVLADDDFLIQLASKIRDGLNPGLRAYIELSNEVWNGQFAATRQAADLAREIGITDATNNKQAAGWYYGYRTAQIENLFKEEFAKAASKPSITTVLAWQSVDTWSFENMVIPGYKLVMGEDAAPEAVAIAPYFGGSLGSSGNEAEVVTWTSEMVLDQLLFDTYGDRLSGTSTTVAKSIQDISTYKAIVDKYNVPEYLAYEGGQHMVASNNNSVLVELLKDANRNRKMYDAYIAYFDAWRDLGGDLFATFASTASYARSGSWGWKERPWHTREEAPKYDAILTWNSNNSLEPQSVSILKTANIESTLENNIVVFPNPAEGGVVTIKFDKPSENRLVIHNLNGKVFVDEVINQNIKTLNLERFNSGMYFFKMNGISKKVIIR